MQTLVNQTTALIYWYYSSYSFTVFILTKHNLTTLPFSATSLRELEKLISAWQRYYQTNTTAKESDPPKSPLKRGTWEELPAYFQEIATTLGMPQITQTIQEINRQNDAQISQLILIPHRDLHRLPLEASFRQYWQQQYGQQTWYQNIAMTRLPSAAFGLKNSRNMRSNIANNTANSPTNLLLVAYANSAGLPRLQYSQTEAAGIKSIWGKSPAKVREFADNSATYYNVKNALCQDDNQRNNQRNNQIFHFSGHGSYNQEQPNLSSLLLSGDDELTAGEIANLSQNSYALAYINACETGVTKMTDIETEYVGLVSAFLRAGVAQVISNLWPMNDEAAGLLAIKFYQVYLAGSPAAIALNQAKTWLQTATWADITQVYAELLENATPSDESVLDKAKSRSEKQNPQDIPFQDACFWAGVVISG